MEMQSCSPWRRHHKDTLPRTSAGHTQTRSPTSVRNLAHGHDCWGHDPVSQKSVKLVSLALQKRKALGTL